MIRTDSKLNPRPTPDAAATVLPPAFTSYANDLRERAALARIAAENARRAGYAR